MHSKIKLTLPPSIHPDVSDTYIPETRNRIYTQRLFYIHTHKKHARSPERASIIARILTGTFSFTHQWRIRQSFIY